MDVDGEVVEEYDEGRDLRKKLDEVTAALGESEDKEAAIVGYRGVLDYVCTDAAGPSESVGKVKEEAIYGLAKAYADSKRYRVVGLAFKRYSLLLVLLGMYYYVVF